MLRDKFLIKRLEYYLSNIILIWLSVIFYRINKYYSRFLNPNTQITLFWMAIAYTVIGFIIYILLPVKNLKESKGATLLRTIGRLIKDGLTYLKNFTQETK